MGWGAEIGAVVVDRTPDEAGLTGPSDSFVSASDTALASHAPTGTNAGVGPWNRWASDHNAFVDAADFARDGVTGVANRYQLADDLASTSMDVYGEIELLSTAGQNTLTGITGCLGTFTVANVAAQLGVCFLYARAAGQWTLLADADGGASTTLTEAWPGGIVPMFLRIRPGDVSGWVKIGGVWIEKVFRAGTAASGTHAGVILANFSGTNSRGRIYNYKSRAR